MGKEGYPRGEKPEAGGLLGGFLRGWPREHKEVKSPKGWTTVKTYTPIVRPIDFYSRVFLSCNLLTLTKTQQKYQVFLWLLTGKKKITVDLITLCCLKSWCFLFWVLLPDVPVLGVEMLYFRRGPVSAAGAGRDGPGGHALSHRASVRSFQ